MILPASTMPIVGGNQPILDIVGNAARAYSLRRLSNLSNSPCIVGAGNNTPSANFATTFNATYDDTNSINESHLITNIGGYTAAGIQTWNDQSGNSSNATRGSTLVVRHPLFYGSAVFNKVNARISPYYYAPQSRALYFAPLTLSANFTVFIVGQRMANATQGSMVAHNANVSTNGILTFGFDDNISYLVAGNKQATVPALNGYYVATFDSNIGIRRNGVTVSANPVNTTRGDTILSTIGNYANGTTNHWTEGGINEVIIYNRSMTIDEITTVENNIRAYYGI